MPRRTVVQEQRTCDTCRGAAEGGRRPYLELDRAGIREMRDILGTRTGLARRLTPQRMIGAR